MLSALLALAVGIAAYFHLRRPRKLPPGPTPWPLLGNLLDLPPPSGPEYKHWLKLKDSHGPISSVTILGQPLILLHDRRAAVDLLDKTSMKTSGRPHMRFAEICGFTSLLNLEQYDAGYKLDRKLVHQQLGTKTVAARFREVFDGESARFLVKILEEPLGLVEHTTAVTGAIILKITYGYSISPSSPDPLVKLIDHTMEVFGKAASLLSWAVDIFPLLECLPEGLPFTHWKKVAREYAAILQHTTDVPYNFVRSQMSTNTNNLSYVSSLVSQYTQSGPLNPAIESVIKNTAVVMYGGGADTSANSIQAFVLAMLLRPAVQAKAQAEIDSVVGSNRLPFFADRRKLPYVNALVKETLRWFPVAPMAVPHRTDEALSYGGYTIPKGSYLLASIWWFLHDPDVYAEPDLFDPERFLAPRSEPDPEDHAFGYGRRVCPGRFLADESLFIIISRMLAVFDMNKARDADGNVIEPAIGGTRGLIDKPVKFAFDIKPRSDRAVELVRDVERLFPGDGSNAALVREIMAA
ncbi:hypothetical protein MCOR25_006758 [Pyricularia grisea]|uniref:Uncharacterized protein n=1 Tax=Pyricularia grisea TaxID=148305 RepID=A0A6P8ARU4_PYRGI|nr:uncharacterized protein PgNI_10045 [Pyricularia grisea]KAI6360389.1 hypothetical protein MCOR25_006758 [Pyricularia grisea]TLD04854.1 hypothetical protein PgNI_10045 [Pyricularia grisea]